MTDQASLKEALEEAVAKERFDMHALSLKALSALGGSSASKKYFNIETHLGQRVSNYVLDSLLRASFLIEIVKTPKIETTKMEVHWANRLANGDPRYARFEDCLQIFEEGIAAVEDLLDNAERCGLLRLLTTRHYLPYELPFDYHRREITKPIHHPSNMLWLWDHEGVKRAIKLRAYLTSSIGDPHYISLFSKAYLDKIKIKTYLTDRVLTGEHKTNREKRWEVHPASVHFAFRRNCMEIEHQLVTQLCSFEGFPLGLRQKLENARLLGPCEIPYRCPATLDPLRFDQFVAEIFHPTHGKSDFQVGHLNPLKTINDGPQAGHTFLNIGWISAHGNRIQGSLTLGQTRKLLGRIVRNYNGLNIPLEAGTEEETRSPEETLESENGL